MKKVAIVAQGLGDGGAERVASILANGLSKYYTVLFVAAYSSDKEYVLNDHVQYTYIDVSAKNGIERLEKRNKRIKKVIKEFGADHLWTLEKNVKAIAFYNRHGFCFTGQRQFEEGTTEYVIELKRETS